MEFFFALIGAISGIITIYSFVTGVSTLREFRKHQFRNSKSEKRPSIRPFHRSIPRKLIWITLPVFLVSLVVTLSMGLSGSDLGGITFLLILISGCLLFLFRHFFHVHFSYLAFIAINTFVVGGIGFVFGSIARGEDIEASIIGLGIGFGTGLLAIKVRSAEPHSDG